MEFAQEHASRLGQRQTGDSQRARRESLREGDIVRVRIFRFDPTHDQQPHYDTFSVPYTRLMRVLDVLNYISEDLEEDLAYRWFCGVKKCGTCAVRVNGREVLACWEAAEPEMTIEPLRHAAVVRDLVIDRDAYERLVVALMPWLERAEPYAGFPERISHREMEQAAAALDCLSCLACFSACPVLDLGDETNFAGPAPLVQLAQVALDPRDGMDRGQLAMHVAGIFNCVSCYKCEEVCPASIPIVSRVIEPLKARAYQSATSGSRHASAFMRIIEKRGSIDPTELVMRTQGARVLRGLPRALRLWARGKINPLRTLFFKPNPAIAAIRRVFSRTAGIS
jgi:fumarate reductase (CoM/CoB) subunit B